ncbi:MAG: hypothetical protein WCV91_06395 [Candidatus Margulisiibacteriota bacterium]
MIRIVDILRKAGEELLLKKDEDKSKNDPSIKEEKTAIIPLPKKEEPQKPKVVAMPIIPVVDEKPKQKEPSSAAALNRVMSESELLLLFKDIIRSIKGFSEKEAESYNKNIADKLFSSIKMLIDQFLLENLLLPKVIEQAAREEGLIGRALQKMLHAVKFGLDANFNRDKLIDLGTAILINGLDAGEFKGKYRIFTQIMRPYTDTENEDIKQVQNLVDIYEAGKNAA